MQCFWSASDLNFYPVNLGADRVFGMEVPGGNIDRFEEGRSEGSQGRIRPSTIKPLFIFLLFSNFRNR